MVNPDIKLIYPFLNQELKIEMDPKLEFVFESSERRKLYTAEESLVEMSK